MMSLMVMLEVLPRAVLVLPWSEPLAVPPLALARTLRRTRRDPDPGPDLLLLPLLLRADDCSVVSFLVL